MLPTNEVSYLTERYPNHSVSEEAGMTCVVIPGWRVPPGYLQQETDLLLRLAPGYPDIAPDMWWCAPALLLSNGSAPQATEATETYLGRQWQRWSRHFTQPGAWRPGLDSLESYLARVRAEMVRSAGVAA